MRYFILILAFFSFSSLIGQEGKLESSVQRGSARYTPKENGFEVNIPFAWKFIWCYGEMHVTITRKQKEITASAYIYNGKRYTASDLGSEAFSKPECGLVDMTADMYENSYRLGKLEMKNVIDYLGGCFGQTYHAAKMLDLNDVDYKTKLKSLSLSNLKITTASTRDYKLESKIKELEKKNKASDLVRDGDRAYSSGDLKGALSKYKEALRLSPNDENLKKKIAKLESEIKAKDKKAQFDKFYKSAKNKEANGDLKGAKRDYEEALKYDPENSSLKNKIAELEREIKEKMSTEEKRKEATSEAKNQSHSGSIWGHNIHSASYGSAIQETNLIGNFRLDYNIWTVGGEVAHKFRFYWEWDDALHTGYPQYVSVLKDTVVQIKELQKYPDLWDRWQRIKPIYVELETDILYWKKGDEWVAHKGRMTVAPEYIARAGQETNWPLPSSSNWDELFTYCNNLDWAYFDDIGVEEAVKEEADKFGTSIAWPKYCFMYSDEINFYFSHQYIHSKVKELTTEDFEKYSSSIHVEKVIWPEKDIQRIIFEYKLREKTKKEDKMDRDDFWNSPDNDNVSKTKNTDFWDTPNNATTTTQQKYSDNHSKMLKSKTSMEKRWEWRKKKYAMLKNATSISYPSNNSTVETGKINLKGKVHSFLRNESCKVKVSIKDEKFSVSNNGTSFSSNIILSEGWNTIIFDIYTKKFGFKDSIKVFFKKPPPLPCDQLAKAGGSGQTINEHGLGMESGVFYILYDMFSAPDELIVYQGPKERRSSSNIIYQTYGKVSGSKRVRIEFNDIETGTVTVEVNGSSGTSWNYTLECPK